MEPNDIQRNCVDCAMEFTISVGEQQWIADRGYSLPKRCPDCRERQRDRKRAEELRRPRLGN
jgi:hypothetical protein